MNAGCNNPLARLCLGDPESELLHIQLGLQGTTTFKYALPPQPRSDMEAYFRALVRRQEIEPHKNADISCPPTTKESSVDLKEGVRLNTTSTEEGYVLNWLPNWLNAQIPLP